MNTEAHCMGKEDDCRTQDVYQGLMMEKKYPRSVYRAFHKFLISYLNFADGEENKSMHKDLGLCTNLSFFIADGNYSQNVSDLLTDFLFRDFEPIVDTHGPRANMYPFGEEDYRKRRASDTMHQCPKRIAWVKKIAEEVEAIYLYE